MEKPMAGRPKHDDQENQHAPREHPAESDQPKLEAEPTTEADQAPEEHPGVPPLRN